MVLAGIEHLSKKKHYIAPKLKKGEIPKLDFDDFGSKNMTRELTYEAVEDAAEYVAFANSENMDIGGFDNAVAITDDETGEKKDLEGQDVIWYELIDFDNICAIIGTYKHSGNLATPTPFYYGSIDDCLVLAGLYRDFYGVYDPSVPEEEKQALFDYISA